MELFPTHFFLFRMIFTSGIHTDFGPNEFGEKIGKPIRLRRILSKETFSQAFTTTPKPLFR